MDGCHDLGATVGRVSNVQSNASLSSDPRLSSDGLEGAVSEKKNITWIECLNLALEILTTRFPFDTPRAAVIGGPTLDHVADINLVTLKPCIM